jgi:hypothetical protein
MSPENMPTEETEYRKEKSNFPFAFAAGAVIVLLLFGGLVLLSRFTRSTSHAAEEKFPLGPAEQTYAERIHFTDIQMAKATNFLNQEFTYVAGTIANDGVRTIRGLEATFEFHDPFNQVILREKQTLVSPRTTRPIEAGQRAPFQITLEHVPAQWNQQYPVILVTGLLLD